MSVIKSMKEYKDIFSIHTGLYDIKIGDKRNVNNLKDLQEFRLIRGANKYFKEWRQSLKLTQDELAYALGVNTHTLSQYEIGKGDVVTVPFNPDGMSEYYKSAISFREAVANRPALRKGLLKACTRIEKPEDTNMKYTNYNTHKIKVETKPKSNPSYTISLDGLTDSEAEAIIRVVDSLKEKHRNERGI